MAPRPCLQSIALCAGVGMLDEGVAAAMTNRKHNAQCEREPTPGVSAEATPTAIKGPRADAARGEPVAWLAEHVIGCRRALCFTRESAEKEVRDYGGASSTITPLYASPLPAPAPAGWRLVPVEPTERMLEVAYRELHADNSNAPVRFAYRAMLAAAPSAPPTDSVSSGTALGRAGASQCQSEVAEREAPRCEWTEDSDGNWETACGQMFVFSDGGPADNDMAFCCYCGGRLAQCSYQSEDAIMAAAQEGGK